MRLDWFLVVRDTLMILVLAFLVVMGAALVQGGLTESQATVVLFLALSVGFCASAALRGEGRFAHVAVVGVFVLAGSTLLNSASRGIPFESWIGFLLQGALPVAGAALVGGAVSLAVKGTTGSGESSGGSSSGES